MMGGPFFMSAKSLCRKSVDLRRMKILQTTYHLLLRRSLLLRLAKLPCTTQTPTWELLHILLDDSTPLEPRFILDYALQDTEYERKQFPGILVLSKTHNMRGSNFLT